MDLIDKIVNSDIGTFINNTRDNVYIRFKCKTDFDEFVSRLDKRVMLKEQEEYIDIYSTTQDAKFSTLVYPMYLKIERYENILGITMIDSKVIVSMIDNNSSKYTIYEGKELLI